MSVTCPTCGAVAAEGARFCQSCGAPLVPGCPRCGAELPPGARFCPSCGATASEEPPAVGDRERRLVTIVFADVTGSTALGEQLDPERFREVMDTYFVAMRQEIEAEGGTVEKFIGDAVMAAFGVPAAHEDDPARALRAALRMRSRLADVNEELERTHGVRLEARIGVNTGDVLASLDPPPGEAMVTGDAVNAAARLQQAAEPGQTIVAERTARAARTFRFRELGGLDLKGKEDPVAAVLLLEEEGAAPTRGVPGLHAPMVGRDHELALLETLYSRVADERRPHLVTIYGEAGVGKSRLAQEFLGRLAARPGAPTVVRGRCLPYGDGITYWPLAEILKSQAGVADNDAPETARSKILALGVRLLAELTPDPRRATALLAYTLGVEDPEIDIRGMEPRQVRNETHAAWRAFFAALAADSPVVAVIEDIHWADPALLDLLSELAERGDGPVMHVCPARPELAARHDAWGGGRRNFSSVALDPLSEADADRLVGLLLSIQDLPESLHRRILDRAGGNPFFLEEIIRHLIDEGRIARSGDRWHATVDLVDVAVPDTVQAVLAARIDLLEATQRRVLQAAAVVGRTFWPGPVRRLLDGEGASLEDALGVLEDRELVVSRLGSAIAGEPEYAFRHVLTRDVAYGSLPRRERSAAHASVARWLEETAGDRAREFAELLAHHYGEAYRLRREEPESEDADRTLRERLSMWLLTASEDARRRFAVQKALALARRALAIAETPIDRAVALEYVGMVALSDYRGDLAWESFREAADLRIEHAPEDGRAVARACARAVEAPLRWPGSMTLDPAEEEVTRYIDLGFGHSPGEETSEHVRLLTARCFTPFAFAGRRRIRAEEIEAARRDGFRAEEIALRIGRPDLASAALDGASSAAVAMGWYGHNREVDQRRLELAEVIDDPWELGDIYGMAAWDEAFLGNFAAAREHAERGRGLTAEGAEGVALHCTSWAVYASFSLGDWDEVVGELVPQVERLLGDRLESPPYFTQHALGGAMLIHRVRGQIEESERFADLLRSMLTYEHAHHGAQGIRSWLAWAALRDGDVPSASRLMAQVAEDLSGGHRPLSDAVRALLLAQAERWDEVPAFVRDARAYAERAGLLALPAHLDRLEGRAALAGNQPDAAVRGLSTARRRFDRIGASWDRACTDLDLARASLLAGREDEGRSALDAATAVFERLGSVQELDRGRELRERLR